MRIGSRQLISPPGARSATGGARSMSYHKGLKLRLRKQWAALKKGPLAFQFKIALALFVLLPCMSSVVPYIANDKKNESDLIDVSYTSDYMHSGIDLSSAIDSPSSSISADSSDNRDDLIPKPTEETPGTPEPPPVEVMTTYEVVSGDTLEGIARRHNTITSYLLQINEIENPGSLHIGQIINVPTEAAGAPTPRPAPTQDPTIATAADIEMLANMIHSEAHWESYTGLIAVGQCAYDRWKNVRRVEGQPYVWNPDGEMTLSDIITSIGQFALADMITPCETCHQAARDVVSGVRAFKDHIVTNFRVHDSVADWNSLPYIGHIGGHAFYGYER